MTPPTKAPQPTDQERAKELIESSLGPLSAPQVEALLEALATARAEERKRCVERAVAYLAKFKGPAVLAPGLAAAIERETP